MTPVATNEPEGEPVYRTRVDLERELAATGVIDVISQLTNLDPTEFEGSMYDVIDPGGLDVHLRLDHGQRVVDFVVEGYSVFVDDEGEIRIYDTGA